MPVILLRLLGYLWAMPGTLVGLLLALPYGARNWRWSDGCLEAIPKRIIGSPGAQTWGWLIYYKDASYRESASLRVHERVHVTQGLWGGPLFMIAYAAHFMYLWAREGFGDWRPAYRKIWAEKTAYRTQDEYREGKRPGQWGSGPS
jgi:hypothetical protein